MVRSDGEGGCTFGAADADGAAAFAPLANAFHAFFAS